MYLQVLEISSLAILSWEKALLNLLYLESFIWLASSFNMGFLCMSLPECGENVPKHIFQGNFLSYI